jgi:hypothetical protein
MGGGDVPLVDRSFNAAVSCDVSSVAPEALRAAAEGPM